MITESEQGILRNLAGRVRELAELPEQAERRRRWTRHNSLDPERPLVLCFPEGAWSELLPDSVLECSDALAREWEWRLRSSLYWWENIRDDNTLEPWFDIPWRVDAGNFGVVETTVQGESRGSYSWDPPLKDPGRDISLLKFREPRVDREATARDLELANRTFGDILPARLRGRYWWTLGLTQHAIKLVGLQEFMELMIEQPETVHRLMAWLRDEHVHFIDWFEGEGLLSHNNRADYVGSGGVGYTDELPRFPAGPGKPVRLADLWGFAESQETVGTSPGMFSEFVLPYQLPLLERFGLNCYGCCEALDGRIAHVLRIPRLRRISVSPWADQEKMAEVLGRSMVFSRKPNPAMICASFDESAIRGDIRKTLEVAGGGVLEIIMKDTHTVQHQPWRIKKWVELALDEVGKRAR